MTAASAIDRGRHGQRVVSATDGDCFRACMSVLLDVPNGDHLPTGQREWRRFLATIGMAMTASHPQGPIWKAHRWIASVPSKNIDGSHGVVMEGHRVLFDPSPRRRYRPRVSLFGEGVVLAGTWLEVADASLLPLFVEWRASVS